jgi:hypothetical protein
MSELIFHHCCTAFSKNCCQHTPPQCAWLRQARIYYSASKVFFSYYFLRSEFPTRERLICSILTEEALWGPFSDAMWPEEWPAKTFACIPCFLAYNPAAEKQSVHRLASIAELGVRFSGI